MQFSIKEWRRYYDKAHELGKILKEAKPDADGNPAIAPLSLETRNNLEFEIKNVTDTCNHYMDSCGLKCPKPLWIYDNKDQTTWPSSDLFEYAHLLTY